MSPINDDVQQGTSLPLSLAYSSSSPAKSPPASCRWILCHLLYIGFLLIFPDAIGVGDQTLERCLRIDPGNVLMLIKTVLREDCQVIDRELGQRGLYRELGGGPPEISECLRKL